MARTGDIAPGDTPKPKPRPAPDKTNAQGYDPIHYGTEGEKVGYAKAGQARNQPGFVPRGQRDGVPNGTPADPNVPATSVSYLNEAQQARVDKLLGDQYDPTKPLNVQLFQARWANATPEERRAIAKNVSSQFLEGGPTSKSLSGFHSEYLGVLQEENSVKQQALSDRLSEYGSISGFAQSQAEADANLKYWTDFAATAEGQAHIAGTGMTPDEWVAHQAESMQNGANNYAHQQRLYEAIARTQQQLGIVPTGMKPPGWESTLAAIQRGEAPIPGASTLANYPGIAADIAGIDPNLYHTQSPGRHDAGSSETVNPGAPTGAEPSGMIYQPLFSSDELASQYA